MTSRFFRRFAAPRDPAPGKASSFHLWWGERREFTQVAVTLEVMSRPEVEQLFFWAIQAGFSDGGAAHLGLQHHPGYPDLSSVNWGGYNRSGVVLDGTESKLPSPLGNRNTRTFGWIEATPYRLTIKPGEGGWDGLVTDLESGDETAVRTLHASPGYLRDIVVWSEVFAPCDHGLTRVRWSSFSGTLPSGETVTIDSAVARYQRNGCTNTSTDAVDGGATQTTGIPRTTRDGATIRWIE